MTMQAQAKHNCNGNGPCNEDLENEIKILNSKLQKLNINGNAKKLNGTSKQLLKRIQEIKALLEV